MKTIFNFKLRFILYLLLFSSLFSCIDFTGSDETVTQQQKKQTPANYYQKKDTIKFDQVKTTPQSTFSSTPDNLSLSTTSTLDKESSKQKDDSELARKDREIEELKLRIQSINKESKTGLVKSTYSVKYEEAVSKILYEMYVKELESLKASNKSEDMLAEKFKKFFTIEYCDDRVLEWLDDFVDKNYRYIARKLRVNYSRLNDPDATSKQIISSK